MRRSIRPAIVALSIMTLLTGVIYPLAITGLAQILFPGEANGSIIADAGRVVGSSLIGQSFTDERYFWGRLSATPGWPYNASASSGSNLGPLNPALAQRAQQRIQALKKDGPVPSPAAIPVDLVTSSASGLDPHISPASALLQVPRIARVRGLPEKTIARLVETHIEGRQFGVLGEPRVNVLALNLALDKMR